jgi:hypothetical protein
MRQNKTIRILFFLWGAAALATSCKKLTQAPSDKYTDLTYWNSPAAADALLNTAYKQMYRDDYFFYNEGLSDNAYVGRGDQNNVFTISSGSFNPSLGRFDDEWQSHYQGIKSCNVLLDNIDLIPNYPAAAKTQEIAQTRFIRAFQYWQLMTWFGDVPLFDHDISLSQSQTIARTPRAQVLAFVLSELDAVKAILPASYDAADQGRITSGAAAALEARVNLYEGNWPAVAAICDTLIHTSAYGTYSLAPSYPGIFSPTNEHNSEVILDEEYVPLLRTYDWMIDFIPISAGARDNALAPTQELVNDYLMMNGDSINQSGSGFDETNPYTNRDPRMTATLVYHQYVWTNPDGSTQIIYIKPGSDPNSARLNEYVPNGGFSSSTGYYIRKYWDPTAAAGEASGLDLILIRYADVLLMYAEAMNELGQFNADTWNQTIGALRTRAGFTAPAATQFNAGWSQSDLRTIIRRERRCELAFEGLRIFDIRRWQTAAAVLNGYVHGAQYGDPSVDSGYIRVASRIFDPSRDYLWPIPTYELAQDTHLTQNPNY